MKIFFSLANWIILSKLNTENLWLFFGKDTECFSYEILISSQGHTCCFYRQNLLYFLNSSTRIQYRNWEISPFLADMNGMDGWKWSNINKISIPCPCCQVPIDQAKPRLIIRSKEDKLYIRSQETNKSAILTHCQENNTPFKFYSVKIICKYIYFLNLIS